MGVDVPNSINAVAADQVAHIGPGANFMLKKKNANERRQRPARTPPAHGQVGGGPLQHPDRPAEHQSDIDGDQRLPR